MPKTDFIPTNDNDFLVWHDRYKETATATAQQTTRQSVEVDVRNLARRLKAHKNYTPATVSAVLTWAGRLATKTAVEWAK